MNGQISFSCDGCGSNLKAPSRKAGNCFPCPNCAMSVVVPPVFREYVATSLPLTSQSRNSGIPETAPKDERVLVRLSPTLLGESPFGSSVVMAFAAGLIAHGIANSISACIVGGALGIFIAAICWLDRSRTTLTVTNTKTILQRSFFSFSTTEVRHSDVRNIQVTQSLGQRLANSGRIKLSTSGQSGFEIEINGIDNPMHVKSLIDKCRR
ncbi:PH domain-containing protein [Planctomicrobium sp. SH668]|uniref:PH domain-containing protein n=1 Tax=Planctomicrobium sp. SH668 TaxID=3448126 RepID=UPI003F5C6B2F